MKRVIEVDVLLCPHCDGRRSLIAFITDGCVARMILDPLDLDIEPPIPTPAHAPELSVFAW